LCNANGRAVNDVFLCVNDRLTFIVGQGIRQTNVETIYETDVCSASLVSTIPISGTRSVNAEASCNVVVLVVHGAKFELQIAHTLGTAAIGRCHLFPCHDTIGIADRLCWGIGSQANILASPNILLVPVLLVQIVIASFFVIVIIVSFVASISLCSLSTASTASISSVAAAVAAVVAVVVAAFATPANSVGNIRLIHLTDDWYVLGCNFSP